MSQNLGNRIHGLQPPLPLVEPDPAVDDPAAGDRAADGPAAGRAGSEWRLDDHTREVGRRGIAAARARLRSASGAPDRSGPARGTGPDSPRRAPGRAA